VGIVAQDERHFGAAFRLFFGIFLEFFLGFFGRVSRSNPKTSPFSGIFGLSAIQNGPFWGVFGVWTGPVFEENPGFRIGPTQELSRVLPHTDSLAWFVATPGRRYARVGCNIRTDGAR
jgi:hypothetical protein